ncbi:MAG: hypothetical protein NXI31_16625 [bacterium]|nr:hypothetical protein [bacterium]
MFSTARATLISMFSTARALHHTGMALHLSWIRITLAVLFAVVPAAAVAGQARLSFTDDHLSGSGAEGWLRFRAVDDLSGEPVVGAEIHLIAESPTPIAGEFWSTRKAVTDARGVVRIPVDDLKPSSMIQAVRHPKYGISTRDGNATAIWRLSRAFDVPVLVLDWRGQPAPGAKVGFCGYCGHTPDLTNAVAGPDGIAVLRGINPHNHIRDVYVQHPGLDLGYDDVDWYPGGPPDIVRCYWSKPMTGRVVDHRGQPVGGAFVSAPDVHRGPWARTAANGAFTILGGDHDIGTTQVRMPDGRKVFFKRPGSYPVTLTLPDLSDPDVYEGQTGAGEREEPNVPTRRVRVRFETSGERLMVTVRRPGQPFLEGEGDTIRVPVRGPFAIEFRPEDGERGLPGQRVYAFDDASELPPEPVVLKWYSPTIVTGRAVDESGNPVAIESQWLEGWKEAKGDAIEEHPDGRFEYRVRGSGLGVLQLKPKNDDLRMRSVWVPLPLRGDERRVDLGDLVLSKTPQLIVGSETDPQPFVDVQWSRAGFQRAGREREFRLGYDGDWQGPDLKAGDVIGLPARGAEVAWREQLTGSGPWRIAPPKGQIVLKVTAADGKIVVPHVQFADQEMRLPEDGHLLRLPTGVMRFEIGAEGYRTAIVDTVVGTELQAIAVELPPR